MKKRVWFVMSVLLVLFVLAGCGGTVPSQQTRAIEAEIKNISQNERSFAAVQRMGIKAQVQEQYQEGKTSTQYKLSLDRFDILGVDTSTLEIEEPTYDKNIDDVEVYVSAYMKKAQTAMEAYFNEGKDIAYIKQEIVVNVKEVDGEWTAEINPSEINIVVTEINHDIHSKAREMAEASEGYFQLQAVEDMRQKLREAIGDEDYAEAVYVESLSGSREGYTITVSYPDPHEVYTKAVESSYATFQASGTLRTTAFTLEDLGEEMQADIQEALSVSDEMLSTTYESDASAFVAEVAEVRNQILNEHLAQVNVVFITPALDMPATSVLSGANSGQSVKMTNTTNAEMFEDVHITFYQLSGTDLEEEGTLALTVFIRKGETLTFYLPVGNYKLEQTRGSTWYGEEVKFGPYGLTDTSSTLIEIEHNYEYTLVI